MHSPFRLCLQFKYTRRPIMQKVYSHLLGSKYLLGIDFRPFHLVINSTFHLSLTVLSSIGYSKLFRVRKWNSCSVNLYCNQHTFLLRTLAIYRTYTRSSLCIQYIVLLKIFLCPYLHVRSPLLMKSWLFSPPTSTKMFLFLV